MNRKCFACIKSAQEVMDKIKEMTDAVMRQPNMAYRTLADINALAEKWINDFGDVDPAWQPPDPEEQK